MLFQSKAPVYGRAFVDTILAALKTVPGAALITAGKIRLSKDPAFAPTDQADIATLAANEADFTGYTAGGYAVSLSAPLNLSTQIQGDQASALIVGGSPFLSGNVCYGYWVDDGTNVILMEAFNNSPSVSFAAAGDYLELLVLFPQLLYPVIA